MAIACKKIGLQHQSGADENRPPPAANDTRAEDHPREIQRPACAACRTGLTTSVQCGDVTYLLRRLSPSILLLPFLPQLDQVADGFGSGSGTSMVNAHGLAALGQVAAVLARLRAGFIQPLWKATFER